MKTPNLKEEPTDFSSEFDEYEGGLFESEPEFEPESDEFETAFADLEEEEEARRGSRAPGSTIRGRTPPVQLHRPPPRRRRPPRTIFRPWRVSAGVIHEPSICICPEQTCPQHGSEYIRWVQSALNRILGMRLPLNGVLTPATRSAVRSFQEREKLPVTGILGPDTERALIAASSGQSPGAGATKPDEPSITEPPEPAATPEPGMTEPAEPAPTSPAAEFDFEWETRAPLRRRPVVVGDGPGVCTCPEPSCPAHGMERFAESQDGAGEAAGFETELLAELVDLDFNEKVDDGISPPPPESADAVERFIGTEHRDIGDLASGRESTTILYNERGDRLKFGEVVALAGDHFETYEEMRDLARTAAGRAKIAWARWFALDLKKRKVPEPRADSNFVMERYYVLASRNWSHFSTGGAWNAYVSWHSKAITDALQAGQDADESAWRRALTKEAFGMHFLTDMFSAGHVRMPRISIRDWYTRHIPGDHLLRYMAQFLSHRIPLSWLKRVLRFIAPGIVRKKIRHEIVTLGGAAIRTVSVGDIVSLALHDCDNRGLRVVSDVNSDGKKIPGGYRWTAVGDGQLGKSDEGSETKKMAIAAVIASLRDLERVRGVGRKLAGRRLSFSQKTDAVKQALPGLVFAARAFVPREDHTAGKNVPLPGSTSGKSRLEWRWGQLGDITYRVVDETGKNKIAQQLFDRLGSVEDAGVRRALTSFVDHLRAEGIRAIEMALGKKAR